MKAYGDITSTLCNVMLLILLQDNQKVRLGRGDIKKRNSSGHTKETKTSEQTGMVTTKQ